MVHLSRPYMTNGKTIVLTIWISVGKTMSLIFNMLSRFLIAFLPRSKFFFFFFNLMVAVTIHSGVGVKENKVCHNFHCFPIYMSWSDGTGCHDLSFLNVEFLASLFTLLFQLHQEALWFLTELAWTFGISCFTNCWSLAWSFEHYIASMWDECNCEVVWTFFGIAFLWDWNETWRFPGLWPFWVFQICWYI